MASVKICYLKSAISSPPKEQRGPAASRNSTWNALSCAPAAPSTGMSSSLQPVPLLAHSRAQRDPSRDGMSAGRVQGCREELSAIPAFSQCGIVGWILVFSQPPSTGLEHHCAHSQGIFLAAWSVFSEGCKGSLPAGRGIINKILDGK